MHSNRPLIALLALICVAFAAVVLSELTGSDDKASQPPAANAPALPKPQSTASQRLGFTLPGLRSFSSITERPLFSPSRRPAARAADSSGTWSSFALVGIIITLQSREALVVHGKPPAIAHLSEGQAVEGWTLKTIYPDHVVFSDRSNEHELKLVDKTPPLPPSGPPSAPRRASP